MSPSTRQEYDYVVKNHVVPYVGHLRISEVNRETFFNLLVKEIPAEEASQVTIRATRKVLSAMCQMAFDEGYRNLRPGSALAARYSAMLQGTDRIPGYRRSLRGGTSTDGTHRAPP